MSASNTTGSRTTRDGRTVILMYHRVTEADFDPWNLIVRPDRFRQQLEVLSVNHEVVPLRRVLAEPNSFRDRVALTFDDGYADNLVAARNLAESGIPATYFVAAGQIGVDLEFWWDEVERIFLASETLPASLELDLAASRLELSLAGDGSPSQSSALDRSWRAECAPTTPRQRAYLAAYGALRGLGHRERDDALERLFEWAETTRQSRENMRALDEGELQTLAALDGAEIGGHTVTHPVLSSLSAQEQHVEIATGRDRLREITGSAVDSFAYPHGTPRDYTAETVEIVADAGFLRACAAVGGGLRIGAADPYQLPRFMVEDWTGAQFDCRLRAVFEGGGDG
jgi:peptidoglycan/xylan/chitin deacetylase (PgdA/CDA1 family)